MRRSIIDALVVHGKFEFNFFLLNGYAIANKLLIFTNKLNVKKKRKIETNKRYYKDVVRQATSIVLQFLLNCINKRFSFYICYIYMISVKMSSVANNSSIQFNAGDIALNDETYLMNKGI